MLLQVAAREAVRAAVEEALGLQLGLMIEFTGLICWRPGSCIGWHHDANRHGGHGRQQQQQQSQLTFTAAPPTCLPAGVVQLV